MKEKLWTVCSKFTWKVKAWAQYKDRSKAEAHAASNGDGWFVKLMPSNPERVIELSKGRSCVGYKQVGLPQYV